MPRTQLSDGTMSRRQILDPLPAPADHNSVVQLHEVSNHPRDPHRPHILAVVVSLRVPALFTARIYRLVDALRGLRVPM